GDVGERGTSVFRGRPRPAVNGGPRPGAPGVEARRSRRGGRRGGSPRPPTPPPARGGALSGEGERGSLVVRCGRPPPPPPPAPSPPNGTTGGRASGGRQCVQWLRRPASARWHHTHA